MTHWHDVAIVFPAYDVEISYLAQTLAHKMAIIHGDDAAFLTDLNHLYATPLHIKEAA